jgi:hypothetical protein
LRADARPEELLNRLVDLEHDLLRFGGVHRQRERREILQAAMAAGCSLYALADALGVTISELRVWAAD